MSSGQDHILTDPKGNFLEKLNDQLRDFVNRVIRGYLSDIKIGNRTYFKLWRFIVDNEYQLLFHATNTIQIFFEWYYDSISDDIQRGFAPKYIVDQLKVEEKQEFYAYFEGFYKLLHSK